MTDSHPAPGDTAMPALPLGSRPWHGNALAAAGRGPASGAAVTGGEACSILRCALLHKNNHALRNAAMLVLHQFTQSPFCVQLRRIMAYKKLAFEVRTHPLADLRRVRRFNPIGKLPALEHRGQWVADSTDIAHYLERQFPDVPILPATPREAALSHVLEDWADESLYFYEMRLRFTFASSARRNLPRMVAMDRGLARWLLLRLIPRGLNGILARQGLGERPRSRSWQMWSAISMRWWRCWSPAFGCCPGRRPPWPILPSTPCWSALATPTRAGRRWTGAPRWAAGWPGWMTSRRIHTRTESRAKKTPRRAGRDRDHRIRAYSDVVTWVFMTATTRRLARRPSGVSLSAMGWLSPWPTAWRRLASMP